MLVQAETRCALFADRKERTRHWGSYHCPEDEREKDRFNLSCKAKSLAEPVSEHKIGQGSGRHGAGK